MIPILDARQMRSADEGAIRAGTPSIALMERAASGVVGCVRAIGAGWRSVVVVCGPGNNGGDGLAAARMLREDRTVRVFTLGDPDAYRGDAAANLRRAREVGLSIDTLAVADGPAAFARALAGCDGIVDALFGTGLDRPLDGPALVAVNSINRAERPVVSADVPSGLSSDTGELIGDAVRADVTVAFGAPKVCHAFAPARRSCGRVVVHDIGIARDFLEPEGHRLYLATSAGIGAVLPQRPRGGHKGDFGRVAIVAGSRGRTGAAILAARGALRGGAGLVTVLCPSSLEAIIVASLPEAMTQGLPERAGMLDSAAGEELVRRLGEFDAAVVGPGLGTAPETVSAIEEVVSATALPLVLDADGLNAFAGRARLLAGRRGTVVATPHPGEAGRLLGRAASEIQAKRLESARELAQLTGGCILLKGEASLVAEPGGRVVVNSSGTPLLATAGSGDVLSGLIGSLLAAGLTGRDAAAAGAWLHGAAGERLEETLGDAGLLAHEVADALPLVRQALRGPAERREA